jgi:predicted transglutaminase-like cysteine proteinase
MVSWVKVALLSLGLGICASNFAVAETPPTQYNMSKFEGPASGHANADLHGNTLPPIGYVDFCARGEQECQFSGGKSGPLVLDTDLWNLINGVNAAVNNTVQPLSTPDQYGVVQYWNYPVTAGDCNSYTLLKKRYLAELGIKPEMLLLTVVLTETGEGHLVLTIPTDKGDYILDNRRAEILRWDETGYIFLKRQSQATAKQWISLQKSTTPLMVSTRARSFLPDFLNLNGRRSVK